MNVYVFPKNMKLGIVCAESLSEVFWRNHLGTTPSLIQFRSTYASNKIIVSSL